MPVVPALWFEAKVGEDLWLNQHRWRGEREACASGWMAMSQALRWEHKTDHDEILRILALPE
jgi:hypothetical protein